MAIKVKFFASLRDQLSHPVTEIDSHSVRTIADVWTKSTQQSMPDHVLCSVNLDHRKPEDLVADGDEVAFFPPVTGG